VEAEQYSLVQAEVEALAGRIAVVVAGVVEMDVEVVL
jgi:hypothetical protein